MALRPVRVAKPVAVGVALATSLLLGAFIQARFSLWPETVPVGGTGFLDTAGPPSAVLVPPPSEPQPQIKNSAASIPLPENGAESVVFGPPKQGGAADLFESPDSGSRRLSQALIGDLARVLETRGAWAKVKLGSQSLQGWVRASEIVPLTSVEQSYWKSGIFFSVIRAPGIVLNKALFIPFGARLPVTRLSEEGFHLLLPVGGKIVADPRDVRMSAYPPSLQDSIKMVKGFLGNAYQIGANAGMAMDGPGLIHILFRVSGIPLPRDLDGLRAAGQEIPLESIRAG
ncbi:MAG: hypothetical protein V3T83_08715, partial [Acidobacteriota bacterium]